MPRCHGSAASLSIWPWTVWDSSVTTARSGRFGPAARASEPLIRLQAKIERALQVAGLPPEGRKFKPHITLARFKSAPGNGLEGYLEANGGFYHPPFPVIGFTLFSSYLSQEGALYRPEADYPFNHAAALSPALHGE